MTPGCTQMSFVLAKWVTADKRPPLELTQMLSMIQVHLGPPRSQLRRCDLRLVCEVHGEHREACGGLQLIRKPVDGDRDCV
jgi:hypothetical protein